MKKTRRQKRKFFFNRKWDLKSGQNGRYNNGLKKGSFLFKKRNEKEKRNGMKKRIVFCGRKKKNMNEKEDKKKETKELRQ